MADNKHYNAKLGKFGEDEVAAFLIGRGHTVLERNWRSGHLEIDLITEAADGIHFVEVKSRKTGEDILPEESIGSTKIKRIAAAAGRYLKMKNIEEECHFDAASVVFNGFGADVRYIPDAYIPMFV